MLFRERQIMNSFKPGDWVHIPSLNTEPVQYRLDLCHLGLEHWQPKPDEWCWFWRVSDFDAPILSRFRNMKDNLFNCTNSKQILFTHCEPFIGQLPTSLKDK